MFGQGDAGVSLESGRFSVELALDWAVDHPSTRKVRVLGAPGEGACPYTNYLGPLRSS